MTATTAGADPTAGTRREGVALAWRILRRDPRAWALCALGWAVFHSLPVATGFALRMVLDGISGGSTSAPWGALALLAGIEVARWTMFLGLVVQWHGAWVGWHTGPRMALLDSLVSDPGPVAGRLPGAPGEAVSRFRDDAQDMALVLDVWLDVVGVAVASLLAVGILATIDWRLAVTIALPALGVMALAHALGPRLRAWRFEARQATAVVTGFVSDTFGAIGAVRAAGAEDAVVRRFTAMGHDRAGRAVRDEVGTQLLYTLSGSTADLALAAALVVAAPAAASGALTVGDLGLVAAYAVVLAGLPRFVGRLGAYQRQADVSADRLARLLPPGRRAPEAVAGDQALRLRAPRRAPADDAVGLAPGEQDPDVAPRHPDDLVSVHPSRQDVPLTGLEVRGLTVVHGTQVVLDGLDLDVTPGRVVAVTGPVGSGKSSLLRAVLGLIPSTGTLRWDGEEVTEPSRVLVPPRVAYVPQVPRLFSEPLAHAVLLGLPPERLDGALHLACMEQDLATMPEGTATTVGSRGVRLSGGQVQRVAAARALVRRPRLLVVDDLSSALDAATEAEMWRRVLTAADLDGTAVLVVTHRQSVLDRADQVLTLG
ncbi:ABC transporter ATP-binding protein [Iamia majanohamensis]|uniref:ABC transporter ATP-binding protein n=1 Tax=Iamia majanohamensis TaxID=467976 RepID=A0AAF0BQX5_9ACTN|nr:ABC transporter ATP-binding protein [Iamia majanohamensis]WCO65571.1 ABC transporter ATP-binding protein [Iamia majanohamensis]